jgi:peroxiredoxin
MGCSSSDSGKAQSAAQATTTGTYNPTFAVKDLDGNVRTYEEFKGKGPVVLNFWGTWCPPCRQEIPDLKKIYTEYKDRGLQLIGLAVQDTPEKVRKFAEDNSLDWVLLMADTKAAESFRIGTGVPVTIFIDRDGNEVNRMIGRRDYETFKEMIEKII